MYIYYNMKKNLKIDQISRYKSTDSSDIGRSFVREAK